MGIVKKTKEEIKADADTTDVTTSVTNLKTALADINARSAKRQASQKDSQTKLDASRIERSKAKKSIAGEGSRLYGLASFADRTKLKTT